MDKIYTIPVSKPGYYQFTMPNGFDSNVQILTWGAGGGAGTGASGGGGGFATSSNVQIFSGNVVSIIVGSAGGDASGPSAGAAGIGASIGYNGGTGANQGDPEDADAGASGGGGAATAILVDGIPKVVAAGGGGGGGLGEDYASDGAGQGNPGGVYSNGLTNTTNGQNGTQGGAGGSGGGGGGYLGGKPGTAYGDDYYGTSGGGSGGQNYGTVTEAGVDTVGAGLAQKLIYSIPRSTGNAGYPGYALLIFTRNLQIETKVAGTWTSVNKVYYKTDTPVTLSNTATQTFSTVGTNNLAVPAGVLSVNVTYPTPGGMVTKPVPVTPGESLAINLGDFGVASSIVGTAGRLDIPAFDAPVFRYIGNVDHIIAQDVQVATDTGVPVTAAGNNGQIASTAASQGIYYNVTYEGWHGDLYATIYFTPVSKSVCLNNLHVYVARGSGRQFPSAHTYQQQPTVANGYIMNDYQGDYYGGEGGYDWTTNLQQQGYVTLDWQQPYLQSGWINVGQIYYNNAGTWVPLLSGNAINLTKIS